MTASIGPCHRDQHVDAATDREEIRRAQAFNKWTEVVVVGMKRMNSDLEYRAKIDSMAAAVSPKLTMSDVEV